MTRTLTAPPDGATDRPDQDAAVRTAHGDPAHGPPRPLTLAEARVAAGLTVTDLARALHVSRPLMSAWERRRRRPARHHWPALCAVLGLHQAEIVVLLAAHPPARLDGEPLPSLALARKRNGLTQRALARTVGVAATTLAMWESAGVRVNPGMSAELARVLDTGVASLRSVTHPTPSRDPRPLRLLRREAGMSQREAAAHLGIALGSLARCEAGQRRPPIPVVRRMAAVYRRHLTAMPVGNPY